MINFKFFKSDFKQITREPIIILLYLAPILLLTLGKISIIYLENFLQVKNYIFYIISTFIVLTSGMLGIATGFMMIDDKDGNIYQLMQITPLGKKGYLINRLLIPSVFSFFYTLIIINLFGNINFLKGTFLILFSIIQTIIFCISIFYLANDKVKGLTYAKGLNIFVVFCFIDLFNNRYLTFVGNIFPSFWITKLLKSQLLTDYILSTLVHLFWLIFIIYLFYKAKK
ncbi:MAG: hypothetical protein ACQEQE_07425 [Bacillota bacterium]